MRRGVVVNRIDGLQDIGPGMTWVGKAKEQGFLPANPAFGKMDRQQWVDLHCRHAELHFGLIELGDDA